MRKLSLLLVALLVISTGAFAQVALEPEIDIEAEATWGINLDEETHGIRNAASVEFSLTLREESDEEFGTGDVYGWIKLGEFEIVFDQELTNDDTASRTPIEISIDKIEARVILGPTAYIDILSAPSKADEASDFSKLAQNIRSISDTLSGFSLALVDDANVATDVGGYTGRVALGIVLPDLMNLEFGVRSLTYWNDNEDNDYALTLEAEIVAVPDFSIDFTAIYPFNDDDAGPEAGATGFAVGIEYSMPLTADINLIPAVGFDFSAVDDGDEMYTRIEFGFGLNLSWAGIGTDEDDATLFGNEDEVSSGLGIGVVFGMHDVGYLLGTGAINLDSAILPALTIDLEEPVNTLGIKVGLFEDKGDAGLLPVIGGALILNYNMLMNLEDALGLGEDTYSELGLGIQVNAALGVVEPYAGLTFVYEDLADDWDLDDNEFMYLNVGADIKVIPNTTFTIDYKSGELLNSDDGFGDVIYGQGNYGSSSRESGQFSIRTKISF